MSPQNPKLLKLPTSILKLLKPKDERVLSIQRGDQQNNDLNMVRNQCVSSPSDKSDAIIWSSAKLGLLV
jgi:hypothetical protein